MKKLNREDVVNRYLSMTREDQGITDLVITKENLSCYDEWEDRFLEITFPEYLEVESLFDFGSFPTDSKEKEAFFRLVRESVDTNMLLGLKKICFIHSETDLEKLLKTYTSQIFDMDQFI